MTTIALRPPEIVMRLQRLGAAHPTRLSFLRQLIRRATKEQWRVRKDRFELDDNGFGRAVYAVETPARVYSLVAFSTRLDDENRSDRVIAQAWDTSYVLYDGLPDEAEIARLEANAPLQEAGRYTSRELVLARANKSVRLFEDVAAALAQGQQPDEEQLLGVGYLLRTTAVYGNGKFGIADRDEIASRPELAGSFQAEMLTVWLIRSFTLDLVDHIAHRLNPAGAARLAPDLRRALGVGNATGLGMAPFLVRHPLLTHSWFLARETALARVRAEPHAGEAERRGFSTALADLRRRVARWHSDDRSQAAATQALAGDLDALAENLDRLLAKPLPWDALYRFAEEQFSLEGQEASVSLILEPHGALVDELGETMKADETPGHAIEGGMSCGSLRHMLLDGYSWAANIDFAEPAANARFWYVSAEKLEPRLGERFEEEGAELEQPLATARDALELAAAVARETASTSVAEFLLRRPEWRHAVRRAQIVARFPYSEIHDNLIGAELRPVDILRAKLAFFGARSFDPRSDRWLRIALFSGEPLIEHVATTAPAGEAG
ncbi:hypothetical protein AB6802_16570 [Mesorhizobium sp. RCC_202]|uniref:hypothetical protein n=1 Tax=Mesorhizobium sp. RCC_202 TaxID=3239222 RepID=UPI003525A889